MKKGLIGASILISVLSSIVIIGKVFVTATPEIINVVDQTKVNAQEISAKMLVISAENFIAYGEINAPGLYGCKATDGSIIDVSESFVGYFEFAGSKDAFFNKLDICSVEVDEKLKVIWVKYGSTEGPENQVINMSVEDL